jgi:hypothetical protein
MQKGVKKMQSRRIRAFKKIQRTKMIKEKIRKMQRIIRMTNPNKKTIKTIRTIRNKSREKIIKNRHPQKRTKKIKVLIIKVHN